MKKLIIAIVLALTVHVGFAQEEDSYIKHLSFYSSGDTESNINGKISIYGDDIYIEINDDLWSYSCPSSKFIAKDVLELQCVNNGSPNKDYVEISLVSKDKIMVVIDYGGDGYNLIYLHE